MASSSTSGLLPPDFHEIVEACIRNVDNRHPDAFKQTLEIVESASVTKCPQNRDLVERALADLYTRLGGARSDRLTDSQKALFRQSMDALLAQDEEERQQAKDRSSGVKASVSMLPHLSSFQAYETH